MTIQLNTPTLACSSCVNTVTAAIKNVDANAEIQADTKTKLIVVETQASENKLITAIALTSILALTQACSSLSTISNAEEPKPIATDNHPNANKHGEHPSDRQKTSSETTIC